MSTARSESTPNGLAFHKRKLSEKALCRLADASVAGSVFPKPVPESISPKCPRPHGGTRNVLYPERPSDRDQADPHPGPTPLWNSYGCTRRGDHGGQLDCDMINRKKPMATLTMVGKSMASVVGLGVSKGSAPHRSATSWTPSPPSSTSHPRPSRRRRDRTITEGRAVLGYVPCRQQRADAP